MVKEVEAEKTKRIADLRVILEKRIEAIETELEGLRVLLGFVDESLLERGFKRAKISRPPTTAKEVAQQSPTVEHERKVPLKTVAGNLLAILYVGEDSMRIALAEDKNFDINTPPFTSFLVERVLKKMEERDREAANAGEIPLEKMLSYDITQDGDLLREITIKNVRSDRSGELKSAVRWTLEKMYEKMIQTG